MLYSVAIVRRPTCDQAASGIREELIYGPVTLLVEGAPDYQAVANKAISDATRLGKLGDLGWDESMYVCGHAFAHFT